MSERDIPSRANYFGRESMVDSLLRDNNTSRGSYELKLQAFKAERVLEVYMRKEASEWKKIIDYSFSAFSGVLGPKLREGDRQIPEGIYQVKIFNPLSKFYLSLGLDYPNERDLKIADPELPGSDIYIHGGCQTSGCIPISDEKMAELYLLSQGANKVINVTILPYKPSEENTKIYSQKFPQHKAFWEKLYNDAEILY